MSSIVSLSNLKNRCALITGATGQLGQVFAETLAELGANLFLVDLDLHQLETLSFDLNARWGINVDISVCNLEEQSQRVELISKVKSREQELNILVNNAAYVGTSDLEGWNAPFESQSVEAWRRVLEVNLISVFELSQGLYPVLKAAKGASIVNITSIYGSYGPDWRMYEDTTMSNPAAYAASKGGLTQFTRWLATTVAPDVRVNAISPGGIFRNQDAAFVERYESRTPLGRMAATNDLRGAMAFLASDLSQYVTGQILEVDGGWGVW
jgi:NAD(P)-dependent dehydrogenase (short-subunit alcohol dehydrogenase family)